MTKILITGAGGFIGQYVANMLQKEYNVVALYRTVVTSKVLFDVVIGDLTSKTTWEMLSKHGFDHIVHCAANIPIVGERTIEEVADNNRIIDDFMIDYCVTNKIPLIYISSSSVYGMQNGVINEEYQINPENLYVVQKAKTEKAILDHCKFYKILRVCAPYGPSQLINTVMKIFLQRALNNQNLFYHGSGQRQQQFTYVGDIANATLCSILKPHVNGIFNIAGKELICMKELAELILKIVSNSTSKVLSSGQEDLQESYRANFDITKAQKILNWEPKVTLEEGIYRWAIQMSSKL